MTFLTDAIKKRDDKVTATAVLSAPAFLSGLTDKDQATIRDEAATQWAPVDFAQLAEARKAITRVRDNRARVEREGAKYITLAETPQGQIAKELTNG